MEDEPSGPPSTGSVVFSMRNGCSQVRMDRVEELKLLVNKHDRLAMTIFFATYLLSMHCSGTSFL